MCKYYNNYKNLLKRLIVPKSDYTKTLQQKEIYYHFIKNNLATSGFILHKFAYTGLI